MIMQQQNVQQLVQLSTRFSDEYIFNYTDAFQNVRLLFICSGDPILICFCYLKSARGAFLTSIIFHTTLDREKYFKNILIETSCLYLYDKPKVRRIQSTLQLRDVRTYPANVAATLCRSFVCRALPTMRCKNYNAEVFSMCAPVITRRKVSISYI